MAKAKGGTGRGTDKKGWNRWQASANRLKSAPKPYKSKGTKNAEAGAAGASTSDAGANASGGSRAGGNGGNSGSRTGKGGGGGSNSSAAKGPRSK